MLNRLFYLVICTLFPLSIWSMDSSENNEPLTSESHSATTSLSEEDSWNEDYQQAVQYCNNAIAFFRDGDPLIKNIALVGLASVCLYDLHRRDALSWVFVVPFMDKMIKIFTMER